MVDDERGMFLVWIDFRRRHLRSIYVPIINFIASPFSSSRKQKYIRKIVKYFIQELGDSKNRRIRVVYNFADSPHTIGDFMVVVMLCRFLALSSCSIILTIIDSDRRSDWNELSKIAQNKRVDELYNLANYLLPKSAKLEIVNKHHVLEGDINLDSSSFYSIAPYFLHLLITKYRWAMPDDFLLKVEASGAEVQYIAWHVRKASYDNRRNLTSISIKSDFEILQKRFPNHAIMLISDSAGLEDAFLILTGSRDINPQKLNGVQILPQPEPGFQNAIPAVLGAKFYFQRGGGGIGMAPMFSSVPYLYLCPDKTYFYGWRDHTALPWSTENQLFVYVKKKIDKHSIINFIDKLKV